MQRPFKEQYQRVDRMEAWTDEAIDKSFPAGDPLPIGGFTRIVPNTDVKAHRNGRNIAACD